MRIPPTSTWLIGTNRSFQKLGNVHSGMSTFVCETTTI